MKSVAKITTTPANSPRMESSITFCLFRRERHLLRRISASNTHTVTSAISEIHQSVVRVRINRTTTIAMQNNHHPEKPSRYNTKMYPTYTSADPVSCSPSMASIGSPTTTATERKSFQLSILNPCLPITRASISEVVILETSAGWNFIGPNSNHEWEPFTSLLTKITSTNRAKTSRYSTGGTTSHTLGLITNNISTFATNDMPNHRNCLPLRQLRSNMEDGSEE